MDEDTIDIVIIEMIEDGLLPADDDVLIQETREQLAEL